VKNWLTEADLSEATGVPVAVIRTGLESGLFDGRTRLIGSEYRFAPGTVRFVQWSSRLADSVIAGEVDLMSAYRQLRRRARRQPQNAGV
jgi:hypothetical protein